MCDHKWVPYVLLATHPKTIMGGATFVMATGIHSLIVTKVKCVECGEERELTLGEPEVEALRMF